jgi:hypothetical protein
MRESVGTRRLSGQRDQRAGSPKLSQMQWKSYSVVAPSIGNSAIRPRPWASCKWTDWEKSILPNLVSSCSLPAFGICVLSGHCRVALLWPKGAPIATTPDLCSHHPKKTHALSFCLASQQPILTFCFLTEAGTLTLY